MIYRRELTKGNYIVSLDTQHPAAHPIAWDWLKSISRNLYALDETPLLGTPPAFPWEKLSQEFTKAFSLENFKITPGELVWKEKDAIMSGIATPTLCTQIAATGIDGTCAFWISHEDVEHFMAKVLQISEVVSELQSEDLVTNFHRFLGIESICLLNQLGYDPRLSFKITSRTQELPEAALCQDIKIQLGNEQMLTRLVISNEFRHSWRTFFLKPQGKADLHPKLDSVETTLHIEAGRTDMQLQELMQVAPGDLVLLDHIFYDQDPEKSRLLITLDGKPLFRARLSEGTLKILEIPLQNEVYTPMVEKVNPPASASNVSPLGPLQQNPPNEQQGNEEEENPFPDEEEDEDEGLELVEAAQAEAEAQTQAQAKTQTPTAKATNPAAAAKSVSVAPTPTPSGGPLTPNDIPIQLIVEVAAVTISVQKLMELAPGNLIDLQISPEAGVNLVVNGRVVGKGELLKIGETLGVRILQIGV